MLIPINIKVLLIFHKKNFSQIYLAISGGAVVLGKLPVPGRSTDLEGVVGWCEGTG